jgi:osmoprotectant transport system substrate-binding protein
MKRDDEKGASMKNLTRSRGRHAVTGLAAAAVALSLAGCGLGEDTSAGGGPCEGVEADSVDAEALDGVEVAVGSKEFDEQLILGQLTLKMMCAAGADAVDETNTKGSTQARQKLIDGGSDVYWDYTGTGWINYLSNDKPITDAQEQYEAVKEADLEQNGLVWGPLAPFNNTYAFATTEEFAQENDLATHSDMAAYIEENPDATVCVESEFAARPDGYPGFKKAYDITQGQEKSLGTGVVYTQVDNGGCDFGEIFTTDGRISALGLQVLEDDKGFFPLYNGVPIVTQETNEENPEILEVLAPLAEVLTTEAMQEMNTRVSADGDSPELVAEEFLAEEGFIS